MLRSKVLFLIVVFVCAEGQLDQSSSYTCDQNNASIEFTLSSSSHSAWNYPANCSVTQCISENHSCRASQTPCFDFHTIDNTSYCAPASLCSILESCDNITDTCSSRTSVCVVNSCCTSRKVCMPLIWNTLCPSSTPITSLVTSTPARVSDDMSTTATIVTPTSSELCQLSYVLTTGFTSNIAFAGLVTGDFNNDNHTDLAGTNCSNRTITIFLGYGNGSFAAQTIDLGGLNPVGMVVSDFNSDNLSDIVVTYDSNHNISLFCSYGNGSFSTQTMFSADFFPFGIAVGDLNNDNLPDFIVIDSEGARVSAYLGYGNGSFSITTTITNLTATRSPAFVIGDFNADSRTDLATTTVDGRVNVLLGYGNGSFATPLTFFTGLCPSSIVIGDFNEDNKTDLVITDATVNSTSIFLGDGNGSFSIQTKVFTGSIIHTVFVGDLNKDNHQDFVVSNREESNIKVFFGSGYGNFTTSVTIPTDILPYVFAVADFNDDSREDLAVTTSGNSTVTIFLNTCPNAYLLCL